MRIDTRMSALVKSPKRRAEQWKGQLDANRSSTDFIHRVVGGDGMVPLRLWTSLWLNKVPNQNSGSRCGAVGAGLEHG